MVKVIVGIDPGVTTAIAALTLEGKPLYIESRRGWRYGEKLQKLMEIGEIILVASDVNPPPALVSKISTDLNAKLFIPSKVLSSIEKKRLAKEYCEKYGLHLKNEHELDAISAALKAFSHYKRKFEQVENVVKGSGIKLPIDDLKERVVKGKTIYKALKSMMEKTSKENSIEDHKPYEDISELKRRIEKLNKKVLFYREECRRLKEVNAELRKRVLALEKDKSDLESKIMDAKNKLKTDIKREREFYVLLEELRTQKKRVEYYISKIEEYEERLKRMKFIEEIESKDDLKPVKKIESFTKEGIERAILEQNIKEGDVVMLVDASGGGASTAKMLVDLGVKVVIVGNKMSHLASEVFSSNGVLVIPTEKLMLSWICNSPYVKGEDLQKVIRDCMKKEEEATLKKLVELVKDYKTGRWRKLST